MILHCSESIWPNPANMTNGDTYPWIDVFVVPSKVVAIIELTPCDGVPDDETVCQLVLDAGLRLSLRAKNVDWYELQSAVRAAHRANP